MLTHLWVFWLAVEINLVSYIINHTSTIQHNKVPCICYSLTFPFSFLMQWQCCISPTPFDLVLVRRINWAHSKQHVTSVIVTLYLAICQNFPFDSSHYACLQVLFYYARFISLMPNPPTWRIRGCPFISPIPFDLSSMGKPMGSLHRGIHNFRDRCWHLYSSCNSAMQQWRSRK
jgi:hypothetical protein